MQPTQAPAQLPQTTGQLDPAVVNLMSGIKQVESKGDYNAKGESGEMGAYQFMPNTFKQWAGHYLGNPNADISDPATQNQVAYARISDLKNQGMSPAQIASDWNSGNPNPTGNVGVNKFGAAYDTPTYVASVLTAAQQAAQARRQSGGNSLIPTANAATTDASGQQPQQSGDALSQQAASPNADWLTKSANLVSSIFPGREVGQDIGTLLGYVAAKAHDAIHGTHTADDYDLSAPSPIQAMGDVAQGALMVGTGMPEDSAVSVFGKDIPTLAEPATALGRIAKNSALGAGFGATGAIASGKGGIGQQTALGAGLGAIGGTFGEAVSKLADSLPSRLMQSALPQLKDPETLDYAMKNVKLGTLGGMINESEKSLASYDNQIAAALTHPQYGAERITGNDIVNSVMEDFPNSEYDLPTIVSKLKTMVPAEANTLTRLGNGEQLTLEQANELRQGLDQATYKVNSIDPPEVKAGKQLAASVGNAIRDAVQTKAPETKAIFSNYSKEIRLFRALNKASGAGKGGRGLITLANLRQLMATGIGGGIAGIPGMVGGAAVDAALESPVTKIAGAKLGSKLAPLAKGVGQAVKAASAVVPGRLAADR